MGRQLMEITIRNRKHQTGKGWSMIFKNIPRRASLKKAQERAAAKQKRKEARHAKRNSN